MRQHARAARGERAASSVLIATCAASAGAHAGLVPSHLDETATAGAAFAAAAVLLAAAAAAVALRPGDRRPAAGAAVVLAGVIAAWAASRVTGLPLVHPHAEPVDALGVVTKVVEAAGLASALWLCRPAGGRAPSAPEEVVR